MLEISCHHRICARKPKNYFEVIMQQQQYDATVALQSVFTARLYYPILIKQQDVRLVHREFR